METTLLIAAGSDSYSQGIKFVIIQTSTASAAGSDSYSQVIKFVIIQTSMASKYHLWILHIIVVSLSQLGTINIFYIN